MQPAPLHQGDVAIGRVSFTMEVELLKVDKVDAVVVRGLNSWLLLRGLNFGCC